MMPKKLSVYTASEAARELGVSPTAVYGWMTDGTLEEVTTIKGRFRFVDAESVLTLKRQRELANARGGV